MTMGTRAGSSVEQNGALGSEEEIHEVPLEVEALAQPQYEGVRIELVHLEQRVRALVTIRRTVNPSDGIKRRDHLDLQSWSLCSLNEIANRPTPAGLPADHKATKGD